jgi:hypothetical protein
MQDQSLEPSSKVDVPDWSDSQEGPQKESPA